MWAKAVTLTVLTAKGVAQDKCSGWVYPRYLVVLVFVIYIYHPTIAASNLMCLLFTVLLTSEKSKSENDVWNPRNKNSITTEMEQKQQKARKRWTPPSIGRALGFHLTTIGTKVTQALIVCLHSLFLTTQFWTRKLFWHKNTRTASGILQCNFWVSRDFPTVLLTLSPLVTSYVGSNSG